jgi:hypothetical protein
MKKEKTKQKEFEIVGLINNPRWKKLICKCDHSDIEKEFPIANCLHCKFSEQEKSMPRKSFIRTRKGKTEQVNKIKIIRGEKYQDIIGWVY